MWPKIVLLLSFPSVPPFSNCFSHKVITIYTILTIYLWLFCYFGQPSHSWDICSPHTCVSTSGSWNCWPASCSTGRSTLVLAIYQHMCLSSVFHIKYIYTSYVLVYCRVWRYSTQFFSGTGTYFRYQIFPLPVLVLIFGTKFFSTSSAVPVLNFGIKFFRFLWFFRYQISPVPVPELFPVPPKTSQELRMLSSVTINCLIVWIYGWDGLNISEC